MPTPPIVVLCQPLYGIVPPAAHANHMEFFGTNMARGLLHGYRAHINAYVDVARNTLAEWVIRETPATHILFVDQDMILPMDALKVLLEDDKDVVSATYFGKDDDHTLVALASVETEKGIRLQDFDETRVQYVAGVGMGCCLIRTDVFRRMQAYYSDSEWFRNPGEDIFFCRRWGLMGEKVWLDGRLQCGHIGDEMITVDHWKARQPSRLEKLMKTMKITL